MAKDKLQDRVRHPATGNVLAAINHQPNMAAAIVVALLLLIVTPPCIYAQGNGEWSILQQLKTAWGNFPGSGTWVENKLCAGMVGVTCSKEGNIVAISLPSSRISGSIPSAIGTLSHLTLLDLSSNLLTGVIPQSLGSLSSLATLRLSSNKLSRSIPASFTLLLNLTELDLSDNTLSGTIPAVPSPLVHLSLFNNNLTGSIPSALFTLPSLQSLEVGKNLLSGEIPATVNLPQLTRLTVDHNSFATAFPTSLLTISTMQYLDLSYNTGGFLGSFPDEISAMQQLSYLAAQVNQLSGSLPSTIGGLSKLISLNLLGNAGLSGSLPATLGNMGSLTYLALNGCNFTGSIPSSLGTLSSLKFLYLQQNRIEGVIPSELGGLKSLIAMSLVFNDLSGSIPASLSALASLTYLSMRINRLEGSIPSQFTALSALQFLDVSSSQVSGSFPIWVSLLTDLFQLSVSHTKIRASEFPSQLSSLSSLGLLGMAGLGIQETFPSTLLALSKLQNLDFADNAITGSIPSTISRMASLRDVNLTRNRLDGPLEPLFKPFPSMSSLDVSFNAFSGPIPPSLGALSSIFMLDLSGNNFSGSVPAALGNLTDLYILNFSNPCPPLGSSCIVKQSPSSLFCLACPKFCSTCNKTLTPPLPPPPAQAPPSPSSLETPSPFSPTTTTSSSSSLSTGAIIGVAVAAVASVAVLITLLLVLLGWRKSRSVAEQAVGGIDPGMGASLFSLKQMVDSTNGWSPELVIGSGGFADVYKGVLPGTTAKPCAVKRAHTVISKDFEREVNAMSSKKHPNLVTLLGYCHEYNRETGLKEQVLVYEYMDGGDLGRILDSGRQVAGDRLLQYFIGVAHGLQYLHASNIIHRDIKPSNVLISNNVAKLSDFGFVRELQSQPSQQSTIMASGSERTRILGTSLYIDPEYAATGVPTLAADVYSYGMLMLVCVCSPNFINPNGSDENEHWSHADFFQRLKAAVDADKANEFQNPQVMAPWYLFLDIARFALQLIAMPSSKRPTMFDAVNELIKSHSTLISMEASARKGTDPSSGTANDMSQDLDMVALEFLDSKDDV